MNIPIKVNTLLLIAAVILLLLFSYDKCTKDHSSDKATLELIRAMADTLRSFRKADSTQIATISVLKTESAKAFLELQSKDSEIIRLQEIVKEYKSKLKAGSSVTLASIHTELEHTGKTTIVKRDTVRQDSLVYIYPTYSDSLKNKWIDYSTVINKDSASFKLKVYNEFSAVVGEDKKRGAFVDLHLYNPYSSTDQLRTYQVKLPRVKKLGVGPNVSYGVGANFKPQVFIGLGIQYNILRL
jgi:hypothetical protein